MGLVPKKFDGRRRKERWQVQSQSRKVRFCTGRIQREGAETQRRQADGKRLQTGSLRYSRLGNLRYDEVPFHTWSSCGNCNTGFCGNCVAAVSKVTGEDRK